MTKLALPEISGAAEMQVNRYWLPDPRWKAVILRHAQWTAQKQGKTEINDTDVEQARIALLLPRDVERDEAGNLHWIV